MRVVDNFTFNIFCDLLAPRNELDCNLLDEWKFVMMMLLIENPSSRLHV